ncbi:MAG: site-specific integrase, partial [Lachnospiraceae bacterium]|nr:site-specific integrase [Lachnospiraceae bacterium]
KTESSERTIYLDDNLIGLLKRQKNYLKDMRIRDDFSANIYDENGEVIGVAKNFVFTSKLGKPFTHEGFVSTLRRIIKRCNEWQNKMAEETGEKPVLIDEDITPHYFRHTFCTRAVEQMVEEGSTDYESLKVLMGHKSIKTSMDVYLTISQDLSKNTWKKAPTMFELSKSDTE